MNAPALAVDGLHKAYQGRVVLAGLSFTVAPGEVAAIVGRNGAGKSTLLGAIAGTIVPDAGEVRIGGVSLADLPEGLTGRELIEFHAAVFGSPGDRAAAEALADLGEAIDHLATTYSVGMRRRLAFACLWPGRAGVFALDEPFAGLDGPARERCLLALEERIATGAGVVLAAHDADAPELTRLRATIVALGGAQS
jgi:ABC-type multidrug transport system ATPase subunit